MVAFKSRAGLRVGKLLVTDDYQRRYMHGRSCVFWRCNCDCGNETWVLASKLSGAHKTVSCGCSISDANKLRSTHNMSRTKTFKAWTSMLDRCYNPNATSYPWYGERGIKVCESWRKSFERFYEDMGPRPHGYSIERKNVNADYSPENCCWIPRSKQNNNTRASIAPELIERIIELHNNGTGFYTIEKVTGVQMSTAYKIYRRHLSLPLPKNHH